MDQVKRYLDRNWEYCCCTDMNDVYYRFIPRSHVRRAERIEMFDEFEEWHLMASHYSLSIAINDAANRTPASSAAPTAAAGQPTPAAGSEGATTASGIPIQPAAPAPSASSSVFIVHSDEETLQATVSADCEPLEADNPYQHATTLIGAPRGKVTGGTFAELKEMIKGPIE